MFSQSWTVGTVALEVLSVILMKKKKMMKIQGLKQLKPRIEKKIKNWFSWENSPRNKNWILCDDVKETNQSRCNHNLDGTTTENSKLGMELP